MDAAQIAAMIADREAGTPGAFEVVTNRHNHHGKIEVLGPSVGILGFTIATDVSLEDAKTIRADMRRIARVPDMEANIIAQAAELERLRAERDALPEQLIDILHVLDVEAQTIANRISGMHGVPCRHPDGVQVLEDAETIIRAAFKALKGGTK